MLSTGATSNAMLKAICTTVLAAYYLSQCAAQTLDADKGGTGTSPANAFPNCRKIGRLFFKLNAPTGQKLYGCEATGTPGTWVLQSSGGGGGSTIWQVGIVPSTFATSGTHVSIANFGLLLTTSNPSGKAQEQWDVDTATIVGVDNLQSGLNLKVTESSASATAYTGGMTSVLAGYTPGMVVYWPFTHSCTGGVATTVKINAQAIVPLKQADGTTDPGAAQCANGVTGILSYDGAVFRILNSSGGSGGTSTMVWDWELGGCSSGGGVAGLNWSDEGGTGQANCDTTATAHTLTWQFINNTTGILTRQFRFPATWSGAAPTFKFSIVNIDGGTVAGNVKFSAKIACFADGATWTAAPYNAVASATVAMTTAFIVKDFSIASIPISGTSTCHAGDSAIIWWSRDNSVGSNLATYVKAMAPVFSFGVN